MVDRSLLRLRRLFHSATDVDEVVNDNAETDPAIHSTRSLVAATAEAVSQEGPRVVSLRLLPPAPAARTGAHHAEGGGFSAFECAANPIPQALLLRADS